MNEIIIVAPYFPPSALPPAHRVKLLVQHLHEYNFKATVVTVDQRYREDVGDDWLAGLLNDKFEKIEIKCLNQKNTRRFGIGDLGLRMLPFLFRKLVQLGRKKKYAFVLYPVPPWYILLIAPVIKKITGMKYGIDFIDPWVHEVADKGRGFKHRFSQSIARRLEGWVTKNADIIFSVSEGINENLRIRHPELSAKPMYAVPYGAEASDFSAFRNETSTNSQGKLLIRYIGALWNDCYPVLDGLMPAIAAVNNTIPLQLEFYGTSYAGKGLAKPTLDKWISNCYMEAYTSEQCLRVSYKESMQLTMSADILFLIGGMQPYYAASKLMGLVVSGKPFVAFLHKDSFPAVFLQKLNYQYMVTYSVNENDWPVNKTEELKNMFLNIIKDKDIFKPLDINHPLIKENTAAGMTEFFATRIASTL